MHIAPKKIFYELSVNFQTGQNAHLKFEILWSRSKTGIDMKVSGLYRESVKSLPLMRWKTIFLRRKFYKKESACLSGHFLVMQYFCIEKSEGVKRMALAATFAFVF